MPIYKVNYGFAKLSDPALDAFTENVVAKMTGHGTFPTPPVPPASLELLNTEFTEAMAQAADGGKANTIIKNQKRAVLIDALRQDALYVQAHSSNDPAIILSSGFNVSRLSGASTPLDTPQIEQIVNGVTTTLELRATPITNAKAYDVQRSTDGGLTWIYATTSPQARQIVVTGLTPGTTYLFRMRAIGGATGFSGWSDAVQRMAT